MIAAHRSRRGPRGRGRWPTGIAAAASITVITAAASVAWAHDDPAPATIEVAPPTLTEPALVPAPGPDPGRARAEGDESFGGPGAPVGSYTIRTLIQTRAQQTFAATDGALQGRVTRETNDADFAARYLAYIRDVKRGDDGIKLNRVFLRATAQPSESFGVKLLVDFAELMRGKEKKALKLAYAELTPRPALAFSAGLFKIPFSLLELLPIADYEFAEVGPTDKLIKNLGFGGRDVGGMVSLAPLHKKKLLRLSAGVFEGNATGAQDFRGPGIVAVRANSRVIKGVRLGADFVWRPRIVKDWQDTVAFDKFQAGHAISVDGIFDLGPVQIRAEWLTGDRTDAALTIPTTLPRRGSARTFMAAWALAAAHLPLGTMDLVPAVRGEWLDTDRQTDTGRILYATASVGLDVLPTCRILLDLSRTVVQAGTYNLDFETGVYDANATTIIGQVQIKL